MGKGYLTVKVTTGDGALPVSNARVTLSDMDNNILFESYTDANGNTQSLALNAPCVEYTLDPNYSQPAYSIWNVSVSADGFITMHIRGVAVVDTQTSILPVTMSPLTDGSNPESKIGIDIPPISLFLVEERYPKGITQPRRIHMVNTAPKRVPEVSIPDSITVRLGSPGDASARNVTVKFSDYIKNVVSGEVYSTWPYNSLMASVHVIVTFALNRLYTKWYRKRGFDFDITNSPAFDQYYRDGAYIFGNISKIVDDAIGIYARRAGTVSPFFTTFRKSSYSHQAGLSKWGSVSLAERGFMPLQILRYYYPNDLELATCNAQGHNGVRI